MIYPPQEAIDLFKKRTNHHIELVQNNIYLWQNKEEYNHIFDELSLRASNHDQSKFSEPELTPYVWLTWRSHCIINNIPFDLPTGMDQKIRDAVFHHVSNNRHHPEWHLDPDSMTEVDLIEMICDWKAVGQEFGEKNLVGYAERVLGRRFNFSQNKIKLIWDLINKMDRMAEENEKIKKQIKEMTPSNKELLKMAEVYKSVTELCAENPNLLEYIEQLEKEIDNLRKNQPENKTDYLKPEIMVSEKLSKEERESLNAKEIEMNINEKIKKNFRWVFELSGHDWSVGHESVKSVRLPEITQEGFSLMTVIYYDVGDKTLWEKLILGENPDVKGCITYYTASGGEIDCLHLDLIKKSISFSDLDYSDSRESCIFINFKVREMNRESRPTCFLEKKE